MNYIAITKTRVVAVFAALAVGVYMLALPASAAHNGAVVDTDTGVCDETTISASIADPDGTHIVDNMYLVVDTENGGVQSEPIPVNGDSASITVGPFSENTTISYRVFGGGERDYDDPAWNGYGEPDFGSDIVDYANDVDGYGWVLSGTDDDNPFTTWNTIEVEGCDEVAPVVEITSPGDGDTVSGLIDIVGSITDDVELSHYNLSLYPSTTDLSDGGTHSGDRLNDARWCTSPTSGTVNLSDDFSGDLCEDWDTTQYADGTYQIRLAARDAAGNRDTSAPETGGEGSVHVISIVIDNSDDNDPEDKNSCKKGGWEDYGFKNQGQCIKFVNTGKDSR